MNTISHKPHFQHMMQLALSQGEELFPKQHFESQTCLVNLFFHSPPLSCCMPSVNMRMMAQSWKIPCPSPSSSPSFLAIPSQHQLGTVPSNSHHL